MKLFQIIAPGFILGSAAVGFSVGTLLGYVKDKTLGDECRPPSFPV